MSPDVVFGVAISNAFDVFRVVNEATFLFRTSVSRSGYILSDFILSSIPGKWSPPLQKRIFHKFLFISC